MSISIVAPVYGSRWTFCGLLHAYSHVQYKSAAAAAAAAAVADIAAAAAGYDT